MPDHLQPDDEPVPGAVREREPVAPSNRDERSSHLAFVAHEIRNPLSTALWSAELLARMAAADRGGPRGEKLAAMALRALSRVRQLVEDHFLCERLDARGLPLRREAVPLGERLATTAGRLGADAVQLDVEDDLAVLADEMLLQRAIDGLLAAAAGSGPVRVEAHRDGDRVVVRVAGTPPPAHGLADPLRGAPPDVKGRALALPAARRAAEAMGGSLRIDADAYLLSLPVAEGGPDEV